VAVIWSEEIPTDCCEGALLIAREELKKMGRTLKRSQ
jgi:hypothetical protein